MLGETAKVRENGVSPPPAPRTWSSPAMRVKLQLVIGHDEGQAETGTDVSALNKNQQRIQHCGLTLALYADSSNVESSGKND